MMRLKSLSFKENLHKEDAWEFEQLSLGEENLIVGKNATGKTRIINVIHNLARFITTPQIINPEWNGEWKASFIEENDRTFEYVIACENGRVIREKISIDGKNKLERSTQSTKIFSEKTLTTNEISPPNDRLALHVRRDKNEFSFLESLIFWADGIRGFGFANTSPYLIEIPGNPSQLTSLNAVPSTLDLLSEEQLQTVLKQLEYLGYHLETACTGFAEGMPPTTKIIFLKEKGISKALTQFEISQGMFRAFSLLTIFEYLRLQDKISTILIDDFGEGLDFERSKKLAEILFGNKRSKSKSKIQFIVTSNDCFLMNSIPLKNLTICSRNNHKIRCLNYSNSKEKFEEWQLLGLNNFDLFSSNFLLND